MKVIPLKDLIILGIDPGQSGGITYYDPIKPTLIPMPETLFDVVAALRPAKKALQTIAYIENVHSMPRQGVASSFKFGRNCGVLLGALAALKIKFVLITPAKWQSALGCRSGGDKNVTKARAQQSFPNLKITHKTADSLLIAEYGWHMTKGIPFESSTQNVLLSSRRKRPRAVPAPRAA